MEAIGHGVGTTELPVVSVIMPVLNEERTVATAIRSVLEQSLKSVEVLVVDGRSRDSTVDVVSDLAAHDPRVRLLSNPAQLIPCGLNVGLANARGTYVARIDAHSTVNDSYLERGVRALEADPDVAAVGGRRNGFAQTPTGRAIATALSSRFGVGDSINHYADEPQDTDHASWGVYRTTILEALGGWDEALPVNEDVDLDHRILGLGRRIRFDPQMEISWHVRETLGGLARQYRRYGRGKAAMVRKNGGAAVRVRHLAAPCLVASLGVSAAAGLAGHRRLATSLALPYPVALTVAVASTSRQTPTPRAPADVLRLAGAFAVMHLGWGLGFLEGVAYAATPAASSARPSR